MKWTVIAQDSNGEVLEIVVDAGTKALAKAHAQVDVDAINAKDEKASWIVVGITPGVNGPPVVKAT